MMWILGLIMLTSTAAHGLDNFPSKYLAGKQKATLTCGTGHKLVTWTLNDQILEDGAFGGIVHVNGPLVTVDEVDTPVLGEYICWEAEQKISSTFLLLEVEEDNLESLSCRAKSYDCSFTCTWPNSAYDVTRLRLDRECQNQSCQWVYGSKGADGSALFELSHSLSPFAEESAMLELNVEAIVDFFILKRTKRFYLRDIVQPDSPKVVKYETVGKELNLTIEPPRGWSSPHSFFSLENEIQYVLKDNGQIKKTTSSLIPKKISKFRVRCRDSYVRSTWSPWTPWEDVKGRKAKCVKRKKCSAARRYKTSSTKKTNKIQT